MKITIYDENPEICDLLQKAFRNVSYITIANCSYQNLERHDALAVIGPRRVENLNTGAVRSLIQNYGEPNLIERIRGYTDREKRRYDYYDSFGYERYAFENTSDRLYVGKLIELPVRNIPNFDYLLYLPFGVSNMNNPRDQFSAYLAFDVALRYLGMKLKKSRTRDFSIAVPAMVDPLNVIPAKECIRCMYLACTDDGVEGNPFDLFEYTDHCGSYNYNKLYLRTIYDNQEIRDMIKNPDKYKDNPLVQKYLIETPRYAIFDDTDNRERIDTLPYWGTGHLVINRERQKRKRRSYTVGTE